MAAAAIDVVPVAGKAGKAVHYSANAVDHIFGGGGQTAERLLKEFGSVDMAMSKLHEAAQVLTKVSYQNHSWVSIKVGEVSVSIKAHVENGVATVTTAAKRDFR
jgi:hypothetical protein